VATSAAAPKPSANSFFAPRPGSTARLVHADLMNYSPEQFEQLKTLLKGWILERGEVLLVEPDPQFWRKFSIKRGQKVDQEFFDLLVRTRPDPAHPVYIKQQSSGEHCTIFGDLKMTHLFQDWFFFKKRNGQAYRPYVQEEMDQISAQLLHASCVCGEAPSVLAEYRGFIKAFPHADVSGMLRGRLADLQSNRLVLQYRCLEKK
jgi:hypothetical protein